MSERRPAPLSHIVDAILVDTEGQERRAGDIWQQQPVVLLLVQRPGCVLCRAHARRLWSLKENFDELGVKPVCLVHEWIKPEISAFRKENWGGDLYLDRERQLYKALGDGKLRKQSFFAILRNFPTLRRKVQAAQKQAPGIGKLMHMAGTKTVLGGLLIVKAGDQGVQYMYAEDAPGDQPPLDKIVQGCVAVTGRHASVPFERLMSMRSCSSEACTPRSFCD